MSENIIRIGSEDMTIKKIKLDGFKNLKNIDLTLNNITSLLSVNSYGKTNLLTALRFGFDFIVRPNDIKSNQMEYDPAFPINVNNLNKSFSFELDAELDDEEIIYGYSFLWAKDNTVPKILTEYLKIREPDESQKYTFYIKRENEKAYYKPSKTGSCNKSIIIEDNSLILNKIQAYDDLYYIKIINELNKLKIFVDDDFDATKPFKAKPILNGESFNYDLKGKNNIPTILYDIQQTRPEKYNLIINTFKDIFPSIENIGVVEIPITDEKLVGNKNIDHSKIAGKFYAVVAKDKNLSTAIHFNNMSDGARRILKILTNLELASHDGCSIVAIEEPENSLNPRILQQYLIALNSFAKSIKIIITSHSPYLINYINPSYIYIGLPNDNGVASFSKIKDTLITRLMNDANALDLNVGDYIFDLMSGDINDLETLTKYTEQ